MSTPYENARSELESATKEGRPDQVLRQILFLDWYHPHTEDFQNLKEALAIASAKGAEHLTDVCFSAMLEFSAGLLLRLQLATERKMKTWDVHLSEGENYLARELHDQYLPALDRVHHHVMALVKAQASCMHLRKLPDKNERVLKYAQATVKVGNDAA